MPRRSGSAIKKRRAVLASGLLLFAAPFAARAQQQRVYRLGVLHYGGVYNATLDGLRARLKQLGLEEGRHFVFHLREARPDLKAVEATAAALEREQVDVLFAVTTSVTAAAKRGTKTVPIVFYAGTDPVAVASPFSSVTTAGSPRAVSAKRLRGARLRPFALRAGASPACTAASPTLRRSASSC